MWLENDYVKKYNNTLISNILIFVIFLINLFYKKHEI